MKDFMEYDFESGEILAVDKPVGWTSFDVVRKLRNLIGKKIGHGGTLDPLASGLLLIATGKYTKKLTDLQLLPKEYTGEFYIGATTPSFDLETQAINHADISHLTSEDITLAAAAMTGPQHQVPPIYSAVKIAGTPSYILARKGKAEELDPRLIEIFDFEITGVELPVVSFRVVCTKGTYIRSLANDFGIKLGVGAYLKSLRRTRIGDYSIDDAWELGELVEKLSERKKALAAK